MNVKELVSEIEVSVNREIVVELKKTMNDLGVQLTEKINALKGEISVNDPTGVNKYIRDLKIEEFKKKGQEAIDILKSKIKLFEGEESKPVTQETVKINTTEQPKVDTQVETPKVETPKVETTKVETQNVEPAKEDSKPASEPVKEEASNTSQSKPRLDTTKLFGIA